VQGTPRTLFNNPEKENFMQDIDVIARSNAKAVEESIPRFVKQGKYVNAVYEGLRFVDISVHDTVEQAQAHAADTTNPLTGTKVVTHCPPYIDPLAKQEQQDAALAAQAVKAAPQVSEVPAPEPRRNLGYGIVQVVALVVTDGKEVWPLPPHQAAAVLHDKDPKQIVALCGPVSDLASVQDAVVLAQAYELRDTLDTVLRLIEPHQQASGVFSFAQQVLDRASPVFASVSKQSAEQQLAEAMKDYDPALTPQGEGVFTEVGILTEDQLGQVTAAATHRAQGFYQSQGDDATPSESQPA
jgi:hypothetical protein